MQPRWHHCLRQGQQWWWCHEARRDSRQYGSFFDVEGDGLSSGVCIFGCGDGFHGGWCSVHSKVTLNKNLLYASLFTCPCCRLTS